MEGTDWIYLAKEKGRQRALVHVVMNLRFQQNVGNFSTN